MMYVKNLVEKKLISIGKERKRCSKQVPVSFPCEVYFGDLSLGVSHLKSGVEHATDVARLFDIPC